VRDKKGLIDGFACCFDDLCNAAVARLEKESVIVWPSSKDSGKDEAADTLGRFVFLRLIYLPL
jgi:hypothetical protein